jgi:hypothetical protein
VEAESLVVHHEDAFVHASFYHGAACTAMRSVAVAPRPYNRSAAVTIERGSLLR